VKVRNAKEDGGGGDADGQDRDADEDAGDQRLGGEDTPRVG
jgi:hypothetical protein